MVLKDDLSRASPRACRDARTIAHKAVQLPSRAARANLPAAADDSHSNLGWHQSLGGLVSQPIPVGDSVLQVGVGFEPLRLAVTRGGAPTAIHLLDGSSASAAVTWLDARLGEAGLKPASGVSSPFELPPEVEKLETFSVTGLTAGLSTLAAWFAFAHDLLSGFGGAQSGLIPGPGPVRCWPHHFDIATYVSLEQGEAEAARGVGVGLSPGDNSYDQPYFYINPWPRLRPSGLPALPAPGHWHTEGFVGIIATADDMLALPDLETDMPRFVAEAFAIGRRELGA